VILALDEFYMLQTLQSQFPLVYSTGYRWEKFKGQCSRCDADLEDTNLRGVVSQPYTAYRGAIISDIRVVDAQGYCPKCNLMTPFFYRLYGDGGLEGASPLDGQWSRWEPRKNWSLVRWLNKIFNG
jgi:hypothetical protein